jgi:hypothetical protein
MNTGRVGEERGGKEMDRCPLTMSTQREVFNKDLNNSNRTKKGVDFGEVLAWSPLPNGRDPRLIW